jgi:hypothetical protein
MEDWRTYFCFGEVPEDWVWGFCLKNSLFKIDNTTEIILGDLWEKKTVQIPDLLKVFIHSL